MTPTEPVFVLDSFALLAYLGGEPAGERVQQVLKEAEGGRCHALLCLINLGEVLYVTERRRGLAVAQNVQALIETLPLELVSVTRDLVLEAAHIKAHHAISYADAFVAALSVRERGIVLTGDPEFDSLAQLVRLEWLPRAG